MIKLDQQTSIHIDGLDRTDKPLETAQLRNGRIDLDQSVCVLSLQLLNCCERHAESL
jgi:hypothetical protein